MLATRLFKEFCMCEKGSGMLLIIATFVSILISNSVIGENYIALWQTKIGIMSIEHWINDGLMAVFFLMIGLELEREIYKGELSNPRDALLPIFAAIGGMAVPAAIYTFFNAGTSTSSGFGIPTATDIAFALAVLMMLGNRVPVSLKVFLTALAVIDDLGAIIVIAIFYTNTILLSALAAAFGIFALLLFFRIIKINHLLIYLIGGVAMWYFMLQSGVHATIAGVLLAFVIPFGKGDEKSPSWKLQHAIHIPVSFGIVPLFALANTAIIISPDLGKLFSEYYAIGVSAGLIIGKPLGVIVFSFLSVKMKLARLPDDISWKSLLGAGFLAGIGFTMSIFITILAFTDSSIISNTKFVILVSSLVAGSIGFFLIRTAAKPIRTPD
ncbi:MAG: Na+/H+ antiporter NhaA [Bacteroidetes bacterium GWF2_43_63]|nr:MAG: Na+/H+ antiporter NhaA [Bacteroidetes bacterium GWE2_42_42]OFY53587.1 MAG: Na+/H+ antiporter NhaA [Bacteroidetes bacterium GWF2_43_63]HBG71080.1 Na+/H+ antiporter NhaA [Bacteroidales bacterium]HCB63658.1 Na+/H+ antiporter NhaA [Bacteroidales bacterium]HCY24407.1 Na+/H+ antiporter NhaA [Bacteroidales bacterium]